MARTFNCGIGMVLIVDATKAGQCEELLRSAGEDVVKLGKVISNKDKKSSVVLSNKW